MKPYVQFLVSAADRRHFPAPGPPEVAFLGRSNVGKSSLLNSLVGGKVAHVSSTPGRTRTINFFAISRKPEDAPDLVFADLPGYGYARLPRALLADWPQFIEPYLERRRNLVLCVVLVDVNVEAKTSDRQLLDWLRAKRRSFLVVGTKSDRLSGNRLRRASAELRRDLKVERILSFSARTGAGREELWREIRRAARNA